LSNFSHLKNIGIGLPIKGRRYHSGKIRGNSARRALLLLLVRIVVETMAMIVASLASSSSMLHHLSLSENSRRVYFEWM
jgi:hypothetical protein